MLYTYNKHISKPTYKQQVKDRKTTISDRLSSFEPTAEKRENLTPLLALFHQGKVKPPPGYSRLFKSAFDTARCQYNHRNIYQLKPMTMKDLNYPGPEAKTVSINVTPDQYDMLSYMSGPQDIVPGETAAILLHCFLVDIRPDLLKFKESFNISIENNSDSMESMAVDLPPDHIEAIERLGRTMDIEFQNFCSCLINMQFANIAKEVEEQYKSARN